MQRMEEDAPKGRQERAMWLSTGLSKGTFILSVWAKVKGGAESKEDHSSLETLLVVHPLLGVGVLIGKVIRAPSIQP